MRDNKLSPAGFKYPERIFGSNFQTDLVQKQPLLHAYSPRYSKTMQTMNSSRDGSSEGAQEFFTNRNSKKIDTVSLRYARFGANLGP